MIHVVNLLIAGLSLEIQGGHKNMPSVRHFKNCGVENLKLTVLEKVRGKNQEIRKARESYWISDYQSGVITTTLSEL